MSKYAGVYALLRERMADEGDFPDSDEIIAAALDAARDAVAALSTPDDLTRQEALAAIDALKKENQ